MNMLSPEWEACPVCGNETILLEEMGRVIPPLPPPPQGIRSDVLWTVARQECPCNFRFSGLKSLVIEAADGRFRMVTEWVGVNVESGADIDTGHHPRDA